MTLKMNEAITLAVASIISTSRTVNWRHPPPATEVAAEARRQSRLQIRQLIQEKLTYDNQESTQNDQSSGKDGVS